MEYKIKINSKQSVYYKWDRSILPIRQYYHYISFYKAKKEPLK